MSSLLKNVGNQSVTFVLVSVTNGGALTGATVNVYVTQDHGAQTSGAGSVTEQGRGQYVYLPTQAETNADDVGFLFEATGAIPVNYDFHTSSPRTQPPPAPVRSPSSTLSQYADRVTAQTYFDGRLGTWAWDSASDLDQGKALTQATTLIDRLNYYGRKWGRHQSLEFPRRYSRKHYINYLSSFGEDEFFASFGFRFDDLNYDYLNFQFLDQEIIYEYPNLYVKESDQDDDESKTPPPIPLAVIGACAEVALKLLDGYDVDKEAKALALSEQKFATAMTRRDTSFAQEWVLAGIPSLTAWNFLRPFLADPDRVELSRVN